MSNCNGKVKNTCGTKNYATCIYYELELPEFTGITDNCVTLEDTTKDVYELIADIREQLDLSSLGEDCLEYTLDSKSRIVVKNALGKIEEKYCELEERVETLETTSVCNTPINDCLDLGAIVDQCDNPPTTYGELLQILINLHNQENN